MYDPQTRPQRAIRRPRRKPVLLRRVLPAVTGFELDLAQAQGGNGAMDEIEARTIRKVMWQLLPSCSSATSSRTSTG
jgi:hypothetical protein